TLSEYSIAGMLSRIRTTPKNAPEARRRLWYEFSERVKPFVPFEIDVLQPLVAVATWPYSDNRAAEAALERLFDGDDDGAMRRLSELMSSSEPDVPELGMTAAAGLLPHLEVTDVVKQRVLDAVTPAIDKPVESREQYAAVDVMAVLRYQPARDVL